MSANLPALIDELEKNISPAGMAIFQEIKTQIAPATPALAIIEFIAAVKDGSFFDDPHAHMDRLQNAISGYFIPLPSQESAFKTDFKNIFLYLDFYLEQERRDLVLEVAEMLPEIFRIGGKKLCGSPIARCRECDDTRPGAFSDGSMLCAFCGAPRRLCVSFSVMPNGRCHYHGGHHSDGSALAITKPGRASIYSRTLSGRLKQRFVEAVTDPDYLSVAPEMAALGTQFADAMADLGEFDPLLIETGIKRAARRLRKEDITEVEVFQVAAEIERLVDNAKDANRKLQQMISLGSSIGRLADTERRRIEAAQQTITVQEMLMLRQETIMRFRNAIDSVAAAVYEMIRYGDPVTKREIKAKMVQELENKLRDPGATIIVEEGDD